MCASTKFQALTQFSIGGEESEEEGQSWKKLGSVKSCVNKQVHLDLGLYNIIKMLSLWHAKTECLKWVFF